MLDAMRAGFRDILPEDVEEQRLVELLRRAAMHAPAVGAAPEVPLEPNATPVQRRVVTVLSPKGGVGKTSISTNLALGLAAQHPNDVVLVDLDLQFGDVAATLDLTPVQTMEHALGSAAAEDTLLLKTMLTVHSAGLFVLPGAENPAANENVTGAQITRLLDQLSSQFSYVVVDTPAGLDEPTLAALESTDDAVLVSTMDVSCVRGVRKEADLLIELGLMPASRMLVLNLADKQSGLKVKDVEAVIGIPVEVVIPRSSDVQLAANHGRPLMLRGKKGGPFVKAIGNLMARLQRQVSLTESKHRRLEVA
ncbi:MAG: P-loop NTPase [Aeromicrobium erythreum]